MEEKSGAAGQINDVSFTVDTTSFGDDRAFASSSQASLPSALRSLNEGDLRLIRIFRSVAEAGGLTAAEIKLNMERSTISRHIQSLEARLGGPVCVRGPTGFELTELGGYVLRAASVAADALDQVKEIINQANGVISGDLYVAVADNCISNPNFRIAEAIAELRDRAPEVTLHLTIAAPAAMLEQVIARKIHLCVTGARILQQHSETMTSSNIFSEDFKLYFCASDARPSLAMKDLHGLDYGVVVRDIESRSRALATHTKITDLAVATGLEAIATLISSGRYVGFLPIHYAESLKNLFPIKAVTGAENFEYGVDFFLAREARRPLAAQTKLFSDIMLQVHGRAAGRLVQ